MDKKNLAPIALFTYNRIEHTRKTLDALAENDLADQSQLFIFCDGPKSEATEDEIKMIEQVRRLVEEYNWPGEKTVIKRTENFGLARNIVDGVSEIVKEYGKIIVLEDDLVSGRGFLKFMNEALQMYAKEPRVMHVSGHMHPISVPLPENFFYQVTNSWGWGTWQRAWNKFENDSAYLYQQIQKINKMDQFDLYGAYNFSDQLKANVNGKLNTWAVKWYASVFLLGGISFYPGKSLIKNIGHDFSGEHCGPNQLYQHQKISNKVRTKRIKIRASEYVFHLMKEFYEKKGAISRINALKYISYSLWSRFTYNLRKIWA